MKFYRTTVTATFGVQVEAESWEEAERIIKGVLDSATSITIREGEGDDLVDELNSDGQIIANYSEIAPVKE